MGVINRVYLDEEFLANVEFKVFSNINIPKESTVSISSDGILGNKYLSITPENRSSSDFLQDDERVFKVKDYESIEDASFDFINFIP